MRLPRSLLLALLATTAAASVRVQADPKPNSGAMDGPDAMKRSVDLGGMASGTFSGKRQKA